MDRLFILFFLPLANLAEGEGEKAPPAFSWHSGYAEALAEARARAWPLLVYFPPARDEDQPRALTRLPQQLGRPAGVVGLRVGADDILELKARFRVSRLPAVVLVDRRENPVAGWEGGIAPNLGTLVRDAVKKLARKEDEELKSALLAKRLTAGDQVEAAWKLIAPLLTSSQTSPEALLEARQVEEAMARTFQQALMRALAAEGLRPEGVVLAGLKELRKRTVPPALQAEVEAEIRRLEETAVGARRSP